jgi:signal transduction histidine kinase
MQLKNVLPAGLSISPILSLATRLTSVFLIATLIAVIVSALISSMAEQKRVSLSSLSNAAVGDLVRAFESGGIEATDRIHDRWRQTRNINVYLFLNGLRVTSRPMPVEALKVIEQSSGKATVASSNWETLTVRRNFDSQNIVYDVLLYRHLPLNASPRFDRSFYWQLFAAFLVTAAVSVFVALRLTKPLRVIQSTIAQVASGDLGARVPREIQVRRDEFGVLAEHVNRMAAHIGRLVAERERVLRHTSHELRSPLMRLRLSLELIRRESCTPKSIVQIDRCGREITRMDRMIEELLVVARLTHEVPQIVFGKLDLMSVLTTCANSSGMQANANAVEISVESEVSVPAIINGNEELLARAIDNLLRNAVRFSPRGGLITAQLTEEKTSFHLIVMDSGPGVPQKEVSAIFEPFYQARAGANQDGHGIGLSLVHHVATLHGARVWAENLEHGFRVVMAIDKVCNQRIQSSPYRINTCGHKR